MVKTWRSHCRVVGSIPGQGTKIPHAVWHGQNLKKKELYECQALLSSLQPTLWSIFPVPGTALVLGDKNDQNP